MSIKIDLKILLFILLFCITSQIEIYLLLMLFEILHELGNLFVGILLGFKPESIAIMPVGMKIEFKPKCDEYNKKIKNGNALAIKRAIVSASGPLVNFIIIFITLLLGQTHLQSNYETILYANFLIGLFNLIPIYPLDGGRILKEILHIIVGLQKSYTYTYKIAKTTIIILTIISSITILYLQNISIIIIVAYLWGIVLAERKRYYTRKQLQTYYSSI